LAWVREYLWTPTSSLKGLAALDEELNAPGFWDDHTTRAGQGLRGPPFAGREATRELSAARPRVRPTRRSWPSSDPSTGRRDPAKSLEPLARGSWSVCKRPCAPSTAKYDAGDARGDAASRHRRQPTRRDWAEMMLRNVRAVGCGTSVRRRAARSEPGRGSRHQVGDPSPSPARNGYGHPQSRAWQNIGLSGRARLTRLNRRHTAFLEPWIVAPASTGRHRGRDRRRRPEDRHLSRARGAGGPARSNKTDSACAHHPPADRNRSCSARNEALAIGEQTDSDARPEGPALVGEGGRGGARAVMAKETGWIRPTPASAGESIRSYVPASLPTRERFPAPASRWETPRRCSTGAPSTGFIREYLLARGRGEDRIKGQ